MRKKIIAFYDVLLLSVICGPLMICSILIFVFGKLHDLEWTLKYWYLVILFAVGIMLPIGCSLMIRYISINNKNSIYFHYFPFTTSWKKAANNIDVKWNQNVFISEIKDIEIVKLTEEEKQTTIVLANPWQFRDFPRANRVFKTNLEQMMPSVNREFPEESKEQRENIARARLVWKMKKLGWSYR